MRSNSIILIGFLTVCILSGGCVSASPRQSFCDEVMQSDFKKASDNIEDYIKANKNLFNTSPIKFKPVADWLKKQDCVETVMPPEAIAQIFPARYSIYINFKTAKGNRMMSLNLQEGKLKNRLDPSAGNEDTGIYFLSLEDAPDGARQFQSFSKTMIENTLKPGENIATGKQLSSFNDQQYLDFYKEEIEDMNIRKTFAELDHLHNNKEWFAAISKLKQHQALYHLLAATGHYSYDVKIAAVRATKELNNKAAIPYLIKVAKENAMDIQGSEESTLHKIFQQSIIDALSGLTHKKVVYKTGDETNALKKGINIWEKNK